MEEEEGILYPDAFWGKWLVLDAGEDGEARASVRGPVQARAQYGVTVYKGGESFPEYGEEGPLEFFSKSGDKLVFLGREVFVEWSQEYVVLQMDLGGLALSLVEYEEMDQGLYVPPEPLSRGLFLPPQPDLNDTLQRWKETHQAYLEYRYQREFSDAEIVRFVRNLGVPLVDDPLRDFKIIQEPSGDELIINDAVYSDKHGSIIIRKNYSTNEWLTIGGVA